MTFATFATQILSGVIWGLISANMQFHVFLLFFYFPFFFRIRADFCEKCSWIVESNRFDGRTPIFFCVLWRSQSFFRKIQVFAIPEFCCVLLLVFVRACKRLFLVLEYANNHHVESDFNFLDFLNAVARVLL